MTRVENSRLFLWEQSVFAKYIRRCFFLFLEKAIDIR